MSPVVRLADVSKGYRAGALRDDAGRVSVTLRSRKETLAVSRLYAGLFRQM